MLNRFAAARQLAPATISATTRVRRSYEQSFVVHAGLLPASILNHLEASQGMLRDSVTVDNALAPVYNHIVAMTIVTAG
jgi:hypothetical protein